MQRKITRSFDKERETKGTWRYAETEGERPIAVATIYLRKEILASLDYPETITVTITT